jgi:hypothetical protein
MYPRKLEGHGELMKMLQTIKKGSVILTLSTVLLGGTVSVKSLALEPESLQPSYANQITSQEYSNNFEEEYEPNDYSENESEYEVSEPVAAAKPPTKTIKKVLCGLLQLICQPRKSPIEPEACTKAKVTATVLGCKGVINW